MEEKLESFAYTPPHSAQSATKDVTHSSSYLHYKFPSLPICPWMSSSHPSSVANGEPCPLLVNLVIFTPTIQELLRTALFSSGGDLLIGKKWETSSTELVWKFFLHHPMVDHLTLGSGRSFFLLAITIGPCTISCLICYIQNRLQYITLMVIHSQYEDLQNVDEQDDF